jgi:glycosyltransferase involved in cell wall biosynthesis
MTDERHPMEDFWGAHEEVGGIPEGRPPGHAADYALGVAWLAPWESASAGFPEHARRCAIALSDAGVPVHLRSFDSAAQIEAWEEGRDEVEARVGRLLDTKIAQYVSLVHMFVPTDTRLHNTVVHARMSPEELLAVNAHRVIYNVWERQHISASAASCLNAVGQAWVGCEESRRVLASSGVRPEKIRVVPCPFMPDDPHLALDGRKRDPRQPVMFYHVGKWEPRKEQRNILGAFMMAFRPGQALLWMKTSAFNPIYGTYPSDPMLCIHDWLAQGTVIQNGWKADNVNRYIRITREFVEPERLIALHRGGDVYVNLSRGEGFDMPALDAKLAGNLMIFVRGGGPADFFGEHDVAVEPTGEVRAHAWYEWGEGATYLDYKLSDAVTAFRTAFERVKAGKRCRGRDLSAFSSVEVGKRMREYLQEIHGVQEFKRA